MQVICPISGEPWQQSPLFMGVSYSKIHPIFHQPRNDLINVKLVHNFYKSVNDNEKRMYFLATLYHTDLVQFHHPARPSVHTVEKNFIPLVQFVNWMEYASYQLAARDLIFPYYAVREDNSSLDNIKDWIALLEKIREDFLKKDENKERAYRLTQEHEKIAKELASAHLKDRAFTPPAARWALKFAKLEGHPKYETFMTILLSRLQDVWLQDKKVMEELADLMHSDNMPSSHPVCAKVIGQLQRLLHARKTSMPDFSVQVVEVATISDDGLTTVERQEIGKAYTDKLIAEYGHSDRPRRADFAKLHEYLQADAKWRVAQTKQAESPKQTIIRKDEQEKENGADPSRTDIGDEVNEHFQEEQDKAISQDDQDDQDEDISADDEGSEGQRDSGDADEDADKEAGLDE